MILIKILFVVLAMNANNKEVQSNIDHYTPKEQISAHGQWEDYYYELEHDKNYNINTNVVR